jgi:DNA-binding transcriptional LysR family regulator
MRKRPMCKASPSCMSLPRRVLTLAISAGLIEPDKPQLRLETSYTYADSVELSGLETFAFRLDRLVVVVAAHHAKKIAVEKKRGVGFSKLLDLDFIGLVGDSALQRYLALHAAHSGKPLKVRVRLRSFDAICRMVESGVGISVIPEAAARRCEQTMLSGAFHYLIRGQCVI